MVPLVFLDELETLVGLVKTVFQEETVNWDHLEEWVIMDLKENKEDKEWLDYLE